MKNFKLLLATTAILSVGAMGANADLASNQADLKIGASFINPIQTIKEADLSFGTILADEGEKYVIITPNGELGEGSNAMMLGMSKPTTNQVNYPGSSFYVEGTFLPGRIRYKNMNTEISSSELNEEELNAANAGLNTKFKLVFASPSVTLTSITSDRYGITCGTVDTFTTQFSLDGYDVVAKIGGKLKTADLHTITGPIDCQGSTTVTAVYNSDTLTSEDNGYINAYIAEHEQP